MPGSTEVLFSTPSEYPYTGPPARLEILDVTSGQRRILVPPMSGVAIIGYRFKVSGGYVWFEVAAQSGAVSLYRAPLDGSNGPVKLLDGGAYDMWPSPDGTRVAWFVAGFTLVVVDLTSGQRSMYELGSLAERATWSADGTSVIADAPASWSAAGLAFSWIDLGTGEIREWRTPANEVPQSFGHEVVWEGGIPMLYLVAGGVVARYSLATGAREVLASLSGPPATLSGWSPDRSSIVMSAVSCLEWSTGPFGGDCRRFRSEVDRVALLTGDRSAVLRHDGRAEILGRLSPSGSLLAFEYLDCGGGCHTDVTGLYVVGVP
jgi:hypothetical protein